MPRGPSRKKRRNGLWGKRRRARRARARARIAAAADLLPATSLSPPVYR